MRRFWRSRVRPYWNFLFGEGSVDNWEGSFAGNLFERFEIFGWALFFGCPAFLIGNLVGITDTGSGDRSLLVAGTVVGLVIIRAARKKPTEEQRVANERHSVKVVNYIGPPSPYFLAVCECGWMGEFHDEAEPAFADAREHSLNVEAEVEQVA